MRTVYLIRHGRTEGNARRLYYGAADLPLSPEGLAELQPWAEIPPKAVFYTSGLRRTEQTLERLFGSVSHHIEPRLREMDFGAFEMHSYADLKDRPDYQAWIFGDNEANVTPGGESGRQMAERVLDAFWAIAREETEAPAVLVIHGGPIAAIMGALFPQSGKNRYDWQPEPGHGYKIEQGAYRKI